LLHVPFLAPATAGAPPDISPKSGKNVRWALAFAAKNSSGAAYSKGFVTPLAGGGYFVGGGAAVPSFLAVISADGYAQWTQTFPSGAKPVDGVQLADGSVVVAGSAGLDWWLAQYDLAGNRQWIQSRRMSADLRDFEVGLNGDGEPEFYLAGYQNPVVITQSDPVLLKLDKDGNVLWTKVYTLDRDDEVYSVRMLHDGNLLLTGRTDSKVGTDLFIGAGANGLLMKVAPDGEMIWSTALPGRWGMALNDSAEGPDGTIYAVGKHGDIVRDYYPSILVAKVSADGELLQHVLIGEDPDWSDELPNGGDTPYDYAAQAAWTGDGLVIVGNTGLGNTTTAWAAKVTDELGVKWFSAFDGPLGSAFEDLTVTPDGFVAMGRIEHPWPTTFATTTPRADRQGGAPRGADLGSADLLPGPHLRRGQEDRLARRLRGHLGDPPI
jgi:hypothetical protein